MKKSIKAILSVVLVLVLGAIVFTACVGSPAAPNGTLESKNGVTVEGTFADGAAFRPSTVRCIFTRVGLITLR